MIRCFTRHKLNRRCIIFLKIRENGRPWARDCASVRNIREPAILDEPVDHRECKSRITLRDSEVSRASHANTTAYEIVHCASDRTQRRTRALAQTVVNATVRRRFEYGARIRSVSDVCLGVDPLAYRRPIVSQPTASRPRYASSQQTSTL